MADQMLKLIAVPDPGSDAIAAQSLLDRAPLVWDIGIDGHFEGRSSTPISKLYIVGLGDSVAGVGGAAAHTVDYDDTTVANYSTEMLELDFTTAVDIVYFHCTPFPVADPTDVLVTIRGGAL